MQTSKYITVTAKSCSIPYRDKLPDEELCDVLTGKKPIPKEWLCHFGRLFNDVPTSFLLGTMKELGIDMHDVIKIYNTLPKVLQGRQFKEFISNA